MRCMHLNSSASKDATVFSRTITEKLFFFYVKYPNLLLEKDDLWGGEVGTNRKSEVNSYLCRLKVNGSYEDLGLERHRGFCIFSTVYETNEIVP